MLHGVQCTDTGGSGGGARQDGGCTRGRSVCPQQGNEGKEMAQVAVEEVS